jgi:hypothetical protein
MEAPTERRRASPSWMRRARQHDAVTRTECAADGRRAGMEWRRYEGERPAVRRERCVGLGAGIGEGARRRRRNCEHQAAFDQLPKPVGMHIVLVGDIDLKQPVNTVH